MRYKLLKELPFMKAGTVFNRLCKESEECCVFGTSFHNDVKHYDTLQYSDNENYVLCSIITDIEWVEELPESGKVIRTLKYEDWTGADAVERYDSGKLTREALIEFIEGY